MGTNSQEHEVPNGGSEVTPNQEMVENEVMDTKKVPTQKLIAESCKSNSLVIKKRHAVIPPHIIAEAISLIPDFDLRFSGPITQKEMEYVEKYVVAKYPEYAGLIQGGGNGIIDLSSFIVNEEPSESMQDDKGKSPIGTPRESSTYLFGSNLPEMDRVQLEPSRLQDILNKKTSLSFVSIPEIQVTNKVLKHCGLPDDEYLVLFTPSYRDALMLVGESYPFVKGNYYMTILGEEEDCIREFASFKESKVIAAPRTWLDLRIRGSQLSPNFRRKCKISLKGLFSYPADVNGTMHWISEAHRNSWHVLLDASALVVGKDRLHLALHRPDFVVCSIDNTPSSPSTITCLLVRKKSFDTSAASSQVFE